MTTDPVTETIYVTWNGGTSFSFKTGGGDPIVDGDLSAYPGANSFTFLPDANQSWRFYSACLSATAHKGLPGSFGLNSDFRITIAGLDNPTTQLQIEDTNRETATQVYEYSFQIQTQPGGEIVDCDPKIYNRIQ